MDNFGLKKINSVFSWIRTCLSFSHISSQFDKKKHAKDFAGIKKSCFHLIAWLESFSTSQAAWSELTLVYYIRTLSGKDVQNLMSTFIK